MLGWLTDWGPNPGPSPQGFPVPTEPSEQSPGRWRSRVGGRNIGDTGVRAFVAARKQNSGKTGLSPSSEIRCRHPAPPRTSHQGDIRERRHSFQKGKARPQFSLLVRRRVGLDQCFPNYSPWRCQEKRGLHGKKSKFKNNPGFVRPLAPRPQT